MSIWTLRDMQSTTTETVLSTVQILMGNWTTKNALCTHNQNSIAEYLSGLKHGTLNSFVLCIGSVRPTDQTTHTCEFALNWCCWVWVSSSVTDNLHSGFCHNHHRRWYALPKRGPFRKHPTRPSFVYTARKPKNP